MARTKIWVEATKKAKEAQQVASSQNHKRFFIPLPKPVNPTTPSAPLKIQKLTRAEMVERQLDVGESCKAQSMRLSQRNSWMHRRRKITRFHKTHFLILKRKALM
jgi:hypothetical protein